MLQQPLSQLCSISSSASRAIVFEQDELCFHVLFATQKSFESVEMAIVSCKNCHNVLTERIQKKPVFYFDPCIVSSQLVAQLKSQCCQLYREFVIMYTDRQTEKQSRKPASQCKKEGLVKAQLSICNHCCKKQQHQSDLLMYPSTHLCIIYML